MTRRAKIILAAVLAPLLLIVLVLAGAVLFLQTDSGRGFLTAKIEEAASDPSGLTVEMGGLEGNILGDFTLSHVRLGDPEGEWLSIERIAASWSPLDLIVGRLTLHAVTAETLTLVRTPSLPPSEETSEPSGGIPELPLAIRLSKFEVGTIHIAEPVIGESAELHLLLNLNAELGDIIHSEIRLTERADKSRLLGVVDFHPNERTLSVDIGLDEPEGGLISRLLALPGYPAIHVKLAGEGPLHQWRGRLDADAGKLFKADATVTTQGEQEIAIDLEGGATLDEALVADIPLLDTSRITLNGAFLYDTRKRTLGISRLDVENAALTATASGLVNPARQTLDLRFETGLKDAAPVNDLIAPAILTTAAANLDLKGSFERIVASLNLHLGGVEVEESVKAQGISGTFTSEIDLATLSEIPVKGSVAVTGIDNLPSGAAPLVGNALDIDVDLRYGMDAKEVTLSALRLVTAHLDVTGAGKLDIESLATTVDITAILDDLGLVAPLGGKLIATLDLEGPDLTRELAGRLDARVENFDFRDAALQPLVGDAPVLSTHVALRDEQLTLSDILLQVASGEVSGTVALPISFETLAADLLAHTPRLSVLDPLSGVTLGGEARLAATLSGAIDNPDLAGKLDATGFSVDKLPLGQLAADFRLASLASSPKGDIKAALSRDQLRADLSTDIALPDYGRLVLTRLDLKEKKNRVGGDLTVPFDGTPMTGSFKGSIPDLASLVALAGQEMSGILDLAVRLENRKGKQAIDAALTGKAVNLAGGSVGIGDVTANALLTDAFAKPHLTVRMAARDVIAGGQVIDTFNASAEGSFSALDYRFDLARKDASDLKLDGAGAVELLDTETRVRLAALDGAFAGRPIRLTDPLALRLHGETLEIATFGLVLGEGALSGDARVTPAQADVTLDIRALPLDLLELVDPSLAIRGVLDGSARLAATKGKPATGKVALRFSGIRLDDEEYGELPAFASTLDADLASGALSFRADVTGLEATTITAEGALPFDIALDPLTVLIDNDGPVRSSVHIDSDINRIWPLLALDTQIMRGLLKADFTLDGSLNAPRLAGQARLTNGYFEDVEQGTILRDMALQADLRDGTSLTLDLSARDMQGGTLKSSGRVAFETLTNPAVDIKIALAKLQVINRDEIMAIGNGDITIRGDVRNLDVTGDVTTDEVEINIGGSVAPSVVNLDYRIINKPGAPANGEPKEPEKPSRIDLDMGLHMPARVFVRGRGLDSEWRGDFTITGTAAKPRIEGKLMPVRGQFTFAGKAFVLQEGEVSLLGGETIDPELSLAAQYEGANVTAIVSITGTASNPKISFSSPDGLPQDEVLSQVLFGKSSGKLSAIEAVQLAETIATLSGKLGSGGGITGFVRDTIGVDVVSARTNERTGEAEVSVGKYVTDNIYVGVDQGAQSGTRAKVQIELTPNISVESEMGQSTDSSVGIFWKWDY